MPKRRIDFDSISRLPSEQPILYNSEDIKPFTSFADVRHDLLMKTQTTFSIDTPEPEKLKIKMKKLLEINK